MVPEFLSRTFSALQAIQLNPYHSHKLHRCGHSILPFSVLLAGLPKCTGIAIPERLA